jgi:hypothetical protein
MNDLELGLTGIAETAAVALPRKRASSGMERSYKVAPEAIGFSGAARTRIEQGGSRKPRQVDEHAGATRRL